jgi:putative transposase
MRKRYTPAFKAKIVQEAMKEEKTLVQLASENGLHPNQISPWKSTVLNGMPALFERENKATTDQVAHEKQTEELYAQIGRLTTQVAWLKKNLASTHSRETRKSIVERVGSSLSLSEQAALLTLSRSTLYYTSRPPSAREVAIKHRLDALYSEMPFYGARRLSRLVRAEGVEISRKTVRAYMQQMGLEAIYPKPNLSAPNLENRIYPHLLRGIRSAYPNHLWGIDITYIRLQKGWMYLMAVLDWYSRYMVSWELDQTLEIGFVLACVDRALAGAAPAIFNSDPGSHFTSPQYIERLLKKQVAVSMDGRGRALDNIFTERLWRTVKYEEVYLKDYATPKEARRELSRYVSFYNEKRLHQSLDYRTPAEVYFDTAQTTPEKGEESNLKKVLFVS